MSTIDINRGDPVLALTGTDITTGFTGSVASFQAGAAGVIGLQLWATIALDGASTITTITFAVETSNDNATWSPTLAIPHAGAGTQDTQPAFTGLVAGATVLRRISVPPYLIGAAKWVRLRAKADAAGVTGDAIGVLGTGW